jgi:hypothetical protein
MDNEEWFSLISVFKHYLDANFHYMLVMKRLEFPQMWKLPLCLQFGWLHLCCGSILISYIFIGNSIISYNTYQLSFFHLIEKGDDGV